MAKTPLDKEVSKKYIEFNTLLMTFFKENKEKGVGFGYPNRGQAKILSILLEQPSISQKDLILQLDMRPQSASELIKKLEKKGFIQREKLATDKRVSLIHLTELGEKEARKGGEFYPIALSALTIEEKQQFGVILDKLIEEIKPKIEQKSHM